MSHPTSILHLLAFVLLGPAAAAQVVPFGLELREGGTFCGSMGLVPDGRTQLADGGLRGKVTVIRSIAFRGEGAHIVYAAPLKSPGRSWSSVDLRLSDCDIPKLTATFSSNSLTPPVLLFQGSVTWPDQANTSTGMRPFEQALTFPLTGPYVSAGVRDVLLDFVFRGGTLKNNAVWGNAQPYVLDAALPGEVLYGASTNTVVGSTQCKDSGALFGPSGLVSSAVAYRKKTGNPTLDGKFFFGLRTDATARLAPVLHALGITGSTAGFPVGACNRLHANPVLFVPALADGSGSAGLQASAPYGAQLVGVPLWVQAGWTDSVTGRLGLTNAVVVTLPQQPPDVEERRELRALSSTATTGTVPSSLPELLPVVRYAPQ